MEKEIKIWLSDIKQAISEIEQFFPSSKMFQDFQKDLKTKRAIERNIEIIGEAVNRILSHYPNIAITSSRKIVDTRNRISHGYDSVSDDIIWAIVMRDLPVFKTEIDRLLGT
ncbi:MAG: photosystem P840 reaction center protein PscD [Crocinitomicaceae bacterium]|nr:photosystem P840 reaction center protein PscD [Crocinitomicaceae bacterium]